MGGYVIRRLAQTIITLIIVSVLVSGFVRVIPGDPARLIAGNEASAATVASIRHELGLDRPFLEQYFRYVAGIFRGDLGTSYYYRQSMSTIVSTRYLNTLLLAVCGIAWSASVGVLAGVVAATKKDSMLDRGSMILSLAGTCAPSFWVGLLLMYLFAVRLHWLPTAGAGSWKHLVLPAVTIGLSGAGFIARVTRANMLDVLRKDYVTVARAKGLPERAVIGRHAFRNALLPTLTIIGLQFGDFLGKAVITEVVFAWPGLARLAVDAILRRDYPVVQGTVLVLAVSFSLVNLAVDLLYGLMDPRIQYR